MVGEIRDPETAKIGVESALTGHLVFSTLHTNNASGVIPRLIDLDVNPKILVSVLSLSIAQRLVRTLCKECKTERPVSETEKKLIETIWDTAIANGKNMEQFGVKRDQATVWQAKGCPVCNNSGYKGRLGIFECIQMDASIESIIMKEPTEREIKAIADKQGTLDMREDGLVKILQGLTDFDEVQSVVDLEEEK
jgi:type IV pilus assembly protein PilB